MSPERPESAEQAGFAIEGPLHLPRRRCRRGAGPRAAGPGSTEPERVAITRPSSGVKPIVVSTERPPATAASEAPAPRWAVTRRSSRERALRAARRRAGSRRRGRGRGSRSGAAASARSRPRAPRRSRLPAGIVGVEGGVEAGDRRQAGRSAASARIAATAGGLCSGARSARRSSSLLDAGVDERRAGELGAAVDDPVPGGVDRPLGQDRLQLAAAAPPSPSTDLAVSCLERRRPRASSTRSFRLDEPALTTRMRAGEARHRQAASQVQSRTSGMSSRCSRT